MRWNIGSALRVEEQKVAARLKRGGEFTRYLREVRPELFDEGFQAELEQAYKPRGQDPVPPALLATVTVLQAYDQVGDGEAGGGGGRPLPTLAACVGHPGDRQRSVLSGNTGAFP